MTAFLAICALVWPAAALLTLSALQDRYPALALYLDRLFPPEVEK